MENQESRTYLTESHNVAAAPNSLVYAAIWWPIGFALAASYFVFLSRRYAQSQRETGQSRLLPSPDKGS